MLPKVKDFTISQAEEVAAIMSQSPDGWSKQAVVESLENNFIKSLVLQDNGKTVAFCAFNIAQDAELLFICTDKAEQRKGYGQVLLDHALSTIKAEKYVLEVRKSNVAAQQLYEKFGFEQIGVRKNMYANPTEDGIVYAIEMLVEEELPDF